MACDTAALLSAVMDEALSALYDFTVVHIFRAHNPTEAERMAVVAVGGYGRSVLARSSDVDLLFVRNYKQTAWAESVIEYMLYALWDMGLKVGHAFRTIDECVKLSREDVTIRTAILRQAFPVRRSGCLRQAERALPEGRHRRTWRGVRRRQAAGARRPSRA